MTEVTDENDVVVTIGVCAMAKKAMSKPMKEILRRMDKFQHIKIIIFDEKLILDSPIESWPVCDALVSFYSEGFPLKKAIAYSKLRKPYLVNDLESQYILMDRRRVYECLTREGVPVPRYAFVDRTSENPVKVVELDDSIEINGEVFHKPFVEKPLHAEDHNIYIYFPSSAGGGSQRLFRKVGNRSSKYFPHSNIRTNGSYMYEEFMPTDGTDVKVYTVADDYAHAEARKSPALDGKVERDHEGKEVRYPVILTPREKIIAKKVAKAVRQQICGFDLLRANGMSYVCDVNGFSFVKSSKKYYDDCSHILGVLITRKIAPRLCLPTNLPPGTDVDTPLVPTTCGAIMELRCVIAVIRHGDRTPKQKMKMEVYHQKFFTFFTKYAGGWARELKIKRPSQLQEILDIVRSILEEIDSGQCTDNRLLRIKPKFEQLKYVLEMYGSFSGINRKIQLKYQPHGLGKGSKIGYSSSIPIACDYPDVCDDVQPCLLVVVKWGGELTAAGKQQAETLGKAFRCIYPGGDGHYGKDPGLGLLRLHSTYRHDLKIYASDEGRVQMTAAAFAKGFLALEGELPPILVQMVKSANTNGLLDNDNDCRHYQQMVKRQINEVMSKNSDFTAEDIATLVPTGARSIVNAMQYVENPYRACGRLFEHEYGITKEEKLVIGQRICTPLMRKILSDARYTDVDECTRLHAGYSKGVASPERFVRSRLYFTSESHIHSLLTCLRYGDLADVVSDEQWSRAMDYVSSISEINYLAQIVIMIYEDPTVEPKTEKRFHVELHFSPGAFALCHDLPEGSGFRSGKLVRLNSQISVMSSGTSVDKGSSDSMPQSVIPSSAHIHASEQDKKGIFEKCSGRQIDRDNERHQNRESFDSSEISFSESCSNDKAADLFRWSFDNDRNNYEVCKTKTETFGDLPLTEQCTVRRSHSVRCDLTSNVSRESNVNHEETLIINHRSQSQGRPSVLPLSPIPSASTLEFNGTPTASNKEVGIGRFTVTRSADESSLSQNESKISKLLPISLYTDKLKTHHLRHFTHSNLCQHSIRHRSTSCSPDIYRRTNLTTSLSRYSCFSKLLQTTGKISDVDEFKKSDCNEPLSFDCSCSNTNSSRFAPVIQWLSKQSEHFMKSDDKCSAIEARKTNENNSIRVNRHHIARSVPSSKSQDLASTSIRNYLTSFPSDEPVSPNIDESSTQFTIELPLNQINSQPFSNLLSSSGVTDHGSDDGPVINQALNAITYPSLQSPYHLDIGRLVRAVAAGAPFAPPLCRSLISTAVIRGSRDDGQASSSVPDFKRLTEDLKVAPRTLTPGSSKEFLAPSAPCVPEVYPLETLHNALTLSQLEAFFVRLTTHKFPTPFTSPRHPSTPVNNYHHHPHRQLSQANLDAFSQNHDMYTNLFPSFPVSTGENITAPTCSNDDDGISSEVQQSVISNETSNVLSIVPTTSAFCVITSENMDYHQ
ncbi:Inositol hexakisphosphate and diphosphoinositol-pentakisphosphate kinase 2 [Schistosoma japonicum]|nr:Inositol hexakisphosphate and diphosphoinositol-pentakisphosphate kinase 2 [Schistosoma japonicum]